MKRTTQFFSVMVVLAVALCFVQCKDSSADPKIQSVAGSIDSASLVRLPIAYINMDSLMSNYNYARDLYDAQLRQAETARANYNEKEKSFQKDLNDFQKKIQNNAFLSEESMRRQQEQLAKKEQELRTLAQRLENEYVAENQKNSIILSDSINSFLKEYNRVKKFEVIFSTTLNGNILLADPKYDITKEVTDLLNKRYNKK